MGDSFVVLKLSDYSYIIRLDAVDERYPGGRLALLESQRSLIGRRVFLDDDLVVIHMSPGASEFRSWDERLESMGLRLTDLESGVRVAADRVYTTYNTGWSEPCDWLGVNQWDNTAWFWKEEYWKGTLQLSREDLATLSPPPETRIHEISDYPTRDF